MRMKVEMKSKPLDLIPHRRSGLRHRRDVSVEGKRDCNHWMRDAQIRAVCRLNDILTDALRVKVFDIFQYSNLLFFFGLSLVRTVVDC